MPPRRAAPTPLSRSARCVRIRDEIDRAALAARCADEATEVGATNAPRSIWHQVARTAIHWWCADDDTWRQAEAPSAAAADECVWKGWCASTGQPAADVVRPSGWAPWEAVCRPHDDHAHVLRWYHGARTNAGFNELDRALLRDEGLQDDGAALDASFVLDDDVKGTSTLTRADLFSLVCTVARALSILSITTGDRLLSICDTGFASAALASACKRRGIPYSTAVVDASDEAVAYRVRTLRPKLLVVDDGDGAAATAAAAAEVANADAQVAAGEEDACLVRTWSELTSRGSARAPQHALPTRSPAQRVRLAWAEDDALRPLPVDASYPLFILFTSGSTGKPKGIVHVHGGYVVGLRLTSELVLGMDATTSSAQGGDAVFVAATPGWITGQSYMISASLLQCRPSVLMRGSMMARPTRFAEVIERHRVSTFKAGTTFLRVLLSLPDAQERVQAHDLTSLRRAAACAEPVGEAVHRFALQHITSRYMNCYWATEHGGVVLGNCYASQRILPARTWALPWVEAGVDDDGDLLLRTRPPYMALTVWSCDKWSAEAFTTWAGDASRFRSYFDGSGAYKQGDAARLHDDGSLSLGGRSDEVINIGGVRLGTGELEDAILRAKQEEHGIQNVVVVGVPDDTLGTIPLACVVMRDASSSLAPAHRAALVDAARRATQPCAGALQFATVGALPETFSGKYMRRLLTAIRSGQPEGDLSALKNPDCMPGLRRALSPSSQDPAGSASAGSETIPVDDDARARLVSAVPLLADCDADAPLQTLIDSFDAVMLAQAADGAVDATQLGAMSWNEVVRAVSGALSPPSQQHDVAALARAAAVEVAPSLSSAGAADAALMTLLDSFDCLQLTQAWKTATGVDVDPTSLGGETLNSLCSKIAAEASTQKMREGVVGPASASSARDEGARGRILHFPGLDGSVVKFAVLEKHWAAAGYTCETVDILAFPACHTVGELAEHVAAQLEASKGRIACLVSYSNGCFLAHRVAQIMARSGRRPLPASIFVDPLLYFRAPPLTREGLQVRMASILARAVARNPDDDSDPTLQLALRSPDALRAQMMERLPQLKLRFDAMARWQQMLACPLGDAHDDASSGLGDAAVLFVFTSHCLFHKTASERLASWRPVLGANAPEPLVSSLPGNHFDIVSSPELGVVCSLFMHAVDGEGSDAALPALRAGLKAAREAHASVRAATDNIRRQYQEAEENAPC